jgi:hypothetical protein
MRLHLAVRSVESWLLADAEAFSGYFGVRRSAIPGDPDSLANPKLTFVNLLRASRRRAMREAIVPMPGSSAATGPGYAASLMAFTREHWRPPVAARRSESLHRLRRALETHVQGRRPRPGNR